MKHSGHIRCLFDFELHIVICIFENAWIKLIIYLFPKTYRANSESAIATCSIVAFDQIAFQLELNK